MFPDRVKNWVPILVVSEEVFIPIEVLSAKYCRVEPVVICMFSIRVTGNIEYSSDSPILLSGLPYVGRSLSSYKSLINIDITTAGEKLLAQGEIIESTNQAVIWIPETKNRRYSKVLISNVPMHTELIGTISYMTSAVS